MFIGIPTPHEIGHRSRTQTDTDSHNNPVFAHADPVPYAVYGWQDADEAMGLARDGSQLSKVVYAPDPCPVRVDDLLIVGGEGHQVERVKDFTKGPWLNPVAGFEIHLKLVKG